MDITRLWSPIQVEVIAVGKILQSHDGARMQPKMIPEYFVTSKMSIAEGFGQTLISQLCKLQEIMKPYFHKDMLSLKGTILGLIRKQKLLFLLKMILN